MELISVIVPVYQVKEYLEECVSSLCSQTYQTMEILLIDDGSLDGSGEICDRLAKQDERIKVYHFENGGLSTARNRGMALAKGQWFAFVDSDDCVSPFYIETLYYLATKFNAQIAVCDYLRGQHSTGVTRELEAKEECGLPKEVCIDSEEMLKQWHGVRKRVETVVWNKLYRRELFFDEKDILTFPEGKIHEDVYLSHRIVEKAMKIALTDKKLYFYRERSNSLTGSKMSGERVRQSIQAQLARLDFFEKKSYKAAYRRNLRGLLLHIVKFYFFMDSKNEELRRELVHYFRVYCKKFND